MEIIHDIFFSLGSCGFGVFILFGKIKMMYSGHEEVENCLKIYWHEDI